MTAPNKAMEIKGAIAAVVAFVTALIGWVGWLVLLWLAAMLADYLTGSWAAIYHSEWSSKRAREGLWHKLGAPAPNFLRRIIAKAHDELDSIGNEKCNK